MKKILIADHNDDSRALMTATLAGDERYQVLVARDGREALELARQERPDLIILEAQLPSLDGFEVCRRLKHDERTERAVVILLAAPASHGDRRQEAEVGAAEVLSRPFSPSALLDKAYAVLGL